MRKTMRKRMASLFLCALMCIVMAVSVTGPALAFADSGGDDVSNITIRITPPSGWATQRADVEVRITDNVGAGFQSAQVKVGGKGWKDVTGELEQTENRHYYIAEVTENCTVSVCVTGLDGRTYEKSEYIHCFNTASDDRSATVSGQDSPGTSSTPSEPTAPSVSKVPAGQGTVVENVTNEDGREFFTIATQDENTFYLIIDRQSSSENVYFLDTVKESDLLSLAEKDRETESGVSAVPDPEPVCICTDKCVPGEVNIDCPVCVLSLKDCTGKAPAADPGVDPEPEKPEKDNSGAIIMVVIAALAVGGAGYYLKIYKPKKDLDDAEDFDELTGEEETVNEDGEDPAPRRDAYGEPEEPDYPVGYGYEEPEDEE